MTNEWSTRFNCGSTGDLLEIVDMIDDDVLQDTARLATSVAGTDFAAITLVDTNRIWFAATNGFEAKWTDREGSFCDRTVTTGKRFIVPDALSDRRFCDADFVVGEMGMRFYAGLPLEAHGGKVVGTLCVASRQPSVLISEEQFRHLAILAEITLDRLDQRFANIRQATLIGQARELSSAIVSEATSIAKDAARLAASVENHQVSVEAAARGVRQVVHLDREIHDSLIGPGRPAKASSRLPDLPAAIESQIDLHSTISVMMEDDVDQAVGSAATVKSRTSSFELQAQRLIELTSLLDDSIS